MTYTFDFRADQRRLSSLRDKHFYNRVTELLNSPDMRFRTAREVAAAAAESPTPCHYISYIRALRVISAYRRTGRLPGENTRIRDMWLHVIAAVSERMRRHDEPYRIALMNVLVSPAPCFFLSPASALRLYHHLKNRMHREFIRSLNAEK